MSLSALRRGRRLRWTIASVGIVCASIAACSFPDLQFSDEASQGGEAGADGTSPPPSATDASGDVTFVPPSDVDPDGGASADATTAPDAIARPEAGTDAGCCDCDKDGYRTAACGETNADEVDCDDFNAGIHPHQGFVTSPWDDSSTHTPKYDWNCDNSVTKQFAYGVSCGALASCGAGLEGDPNCGEAGTFETCKAGLNLLGVQVCSADSNNPPYTTTQGCH